MADAATTRYAMVKPEVGASADTWGGKLNTNFDDLDALLGAITTGGSSNAYTLTTGLSLASLVNGQRFLVKWNHTSTGAATLNVDGIGATTITRRDGSTAIASGDLAQNAYAFVVYDSAGPRFRVITPVVTEFQGKDATLDAVSALSWSSGNALVQFTAADTVSLTLSPTVTALTLSADSGVLLTITDTTTPVTATFGPTGDNAFRLGTTTAHPFDIYTNNTFRARFSSGGQFQINPDGSASAPALCWVNDADCGFYRIGANNIGAAANGALVWQWDAAGIKDANGNILKSTGKTMVPIPASAMVANTTNGAATATWESATNDVMMRTLDFDQTTQEGAQFVFPMPKSWNEGTVTFQPIWTAAAGSAAQTVDFELRAVALSDDDAIDASWGTGQVSSDALIATGDVHIGPESSAITIGGTPAEGDLVAFQVRRNVATDNLAADARLIGIRLFITLNAANDA